MEMFGTQVKVGAAYSLHPVSQIYDRNVLCTCVTCFVVIVSQWGSWSNDKKYACVNGFCHGPYYRVSLKGNRNSKIWLTYALMANPGWQSRALFMGSGQYFPTTFMLISSYAIISNFLGTAVATKEHWAFASWNKKRNVLHIQLSIGSPGRRPPDNAFYC